MKFRRVWMALVVCVFGLALVVCPAVAQQTQQKDPLEAWKPKFDPSGAKYKFTVSNVSTPALKGVFAGFVIRDEIWKRTNGQMYLDYKPFSMLGGEVEVLNQLQMGSIQGMAVSSVASTNLGPRFGVVNLPFLIDSFEKLDKFVGSGKLFDHFLMAMDHQGIIALDITGYGNYGWASKVPIKTIADLKKVKIRIAEAAVNKLTYEAWGTNPVVMPWPDAHMALNQGVIDGLDHTLTVCGLTGKFELVKNFTQINYAQGLFIWTFNKKWFESIPPDLQKTLKDVVKEVSAQIRKETVSQEDEEIEKDKKGGVQFFKLSAEEMEILRKQGNAVHQKYAEEINKLYPGDKEKYDDYLKAVQDYMGYKRP